MVERSLAWLVRPGRRVAYRGTARNRIWLAHRAAAINLQRLINLGLTHNGTLATRHLNTARSKTTRHLIYGINPTSRTSPTPAHRPRRTPDPHHATHAHNGPCSAVS